MTCQDISLRCGKIERCFSGLPLVCEWKELVLCSPSSCLRQVKPSCRQDRRIIKVFWSGKGRTPSNCLRDCTSRDRRHVTSRKDSKTLALVCVVVPRWFCQDTPFKYFAAWTSCQECRGILWYSRHVSFFLDLELLFMSWNRSSSRPVHRYVGVFQRFNKTFKHVALRRCWPSRAAPMPSKRSMACFVRHPLVGPSNARKPYHSCSSLQFGQPKSS